MKHTSTIFDIRACREFDDHEMIVAFNDITSRLHGYIGVHSTKRGPALGGTRLQIYESSELALRDVLNLSKAMSYKCALANLPYGGGKGVIVANDIVDRDQALQAYARVIENLRGLFKTGTDVGVSDQDVQIMGQTTTHMLGLTKADRGDLSTSSCAALGVFYAMKAALVQLYGDDTFHSRSIAIKGTGKLGAELARLLNEAGANLILADVDTDKVQNVANDLTNVTTVPVNDIAQSNVDIYAPCALGSEFTSESINSLNCKAVVGGANNQLTNTAAGDALYDTGILYVPDYIANAGGLIYVADELEAGGFAKERVLQRVKDIQHTAQAIMERSNNDHQPSYIVADTIALERIQGSVL